MFNVAHSIGIQTDQLLQHQCNDKHYNQAWYAVLQPDTLYLLFHLAIEKIDRR